MQHREKRDNKENCWEELQDDRNKIKRQRCDSRKDNGNRLPWNFNGSAFAPADFILQLHEIYEKTENIPSSPENRVQNQYYVEETQGFLVRKYLSSRDSAAIFLRKLSSRDFLEVKMESKNDDIRELSNNYAVESSATYREPQPITEELDAKNILRMLDETVESGDLSSCHQYIRSLENYNSLYIRERGVCSPLNDRIVELKSDVEVAEYTYRSTSY